VHRSNRVRAIARACGVAVWAATVTSGCESDCVVDATHAPQLTATIQVPDHALDAFDVAWFDAASQRYYLADRANAGVEVVDAQRNRYLGRITGFSGSADHDRSGPNGVVVVSREHQLWAGDGDSSVKVVDLATNEAMRVSTGGAARADELSYAAAIGVVLVVNNEEETTDDPASGPFATLISTEPDHAILGKIVFHEATAGLEQSVWDARSGHFLLAVPELGGDAARGEIAVIDPKARAVVAHYPVAECEPAGLALGPANQLLVGCSGDAIEAGFAAKSLILDTRDGSELASIPEVGGSDEVWYDAGDHHYYLAARDNPGGPVLGVIDAATLRFATNVPTGPDSKSVAVDPSGQIFVPLTPTAAAFANDPGRGLKCDHGCIGVFTNPSSCEPSGLPGLGAVRNRKPRS
jgi:DNA-binding beta-propeller fold protein YncE